MKNLYLGLFFICVVCLSFFQECRTILAQSPPSQPVVIQAVPTNSTREDLKRLKEQVTQLELDLAKASQAPQEAELTFALIPGLATLGAAIVAGIFAFLGQHHMAKREEARAILNAQRGMELARQEALFQHAEKILEFRLKQMELFYAPMFAFLEQSRALYNKMLHQLANDEPSRYKELSEPDAEGFRFHVLAKDNSWKGFRLLDQLPAIRANPKALALVERILEIGEQMTKTISEYAGLASPDLVDLLGEYLAHYAILSTIHKRNETDPYEPGWHKTGYYPRELNQKIAAGYHELSQFLDEYNKKTKRMLDDLPERS